MIAVPCVELRHCFLPSHQVCLFFIVPAQLESLTGRVVRHRSDPALACEGGQQRDAVDQLEMHFYGIQLELYDAKFEILKYEEQLLVAQIDSLRRQMRGGFHTVGRSVPGGPLLKQTHRQQIGAKGHVEIPDERSSR